MKVSKVLGVGVSLLLAVGLLSGYDALPLRKDIDAFLQHKEGAAQRTAL